MRYNKHVDKKRKVGIKMSWTNECLESSEFKVKQIKEVREVLNLMGFVTYETEGKVCFYSSGEGTWFDEDTEVVLSLKPFEKEGNVTNLIGIISDNIMNSVDLDELEKDTYMVVNITEYLQDQLVDEEEFISMVDCGFESRSGGDSNPFGCAVFITKNNVKWINLGCWVDKQVEELRAGV